MHTNLPFVMTTETYSLTTPFIATQGFRQRWARSILFRTLSGVQHGRLVVRDAEEDYSIGEEGVPGVHMAVHHPRFYRRVLSGGSLSLAESYMDGDWTCDDLTGLIRLMIRNMHLSDSIDGMRSFATRWAGRIGHWLSRNTRLGSRDNIRAHYDLGNALFELFLDETMTYSSGIFPDEASSLHEASLAKLDRMCRLVDLRAEDHLLEIGSGWGSLALHAASKYGCRVTTTTISREQQRLATQRVADAGLSDRVTVLLQDYRDLRGTYDKLISIEMIEAVGYDFLDDYFRQCSRLLAPTGTMALQGITIAEQRMDGYLRDVDFIQKYIFPGGCLTSIGTLGQSIARVTDMRVAKVDDFAGHYARTLAAWRERFGKQLDAVRSLGYDDRFIRMWNYYLSYCEAAFLERSCGVVQMLLCKPLSRRDDTLMDVDRVERKAPVSSDAP